MSLLIAVCLLLLSSSSDSNHYGADHHHPQAVPGRYPPRYDPVTACEDHHIMPENTEELPPIADTVLSTEDVLILTLKHCNDILESERTHTRDTLKAERDHATFKIGQIIESQETINKALHSRIQDLEASDKNQQQILKRIVNLEQKIETTTKTVNTALEILEEAIANVNLKTQTKILYQEKLLYNLKHALFDTLSTIRKEKSSSSDTLQTTRNCTFEHHKNPITEETENYPCDEINEIIPQMDGNDTIETADDMDDRNDVVEITEEQIYRQDPTLLQAGFTFEVNERCSTSSRTASFSLNKPKQVLGLASDTSITDFEIEVNDGDKNVNIKCSTAFYDTVAKPVMCGLSLDTTLNLNNVSINCYHIDYNKDRNGTEFNRVFHIRIGGSGQHQIGKVTVHLHHTKRTIQMQGSAVMPDGSKAPLWFLNSFVKERFTNLAKIKQYDIKKLNDAIKKAVEASTESGNLTSNCSRCLRQYGSKSRPTQCSSCHQYFHKTNCFPAHSSVCKSQLNRSKTTFPSSPCSSNTSQATSNPTKRARVETSGNNTLILSEPSPTLVPPAAITKATSSEAADLTCISRCDPSFPSTLLASKAPTTQTTQATSPPPSPPATSSLSLLNPAATPFSFTASVSQPHNTQKRRTKQKQTVVSPEAAKIDYLNVELNACKTQIAQLETTIADRDDTIHIQKEKLKVLEQNLSEAITSKYLPNTKQKTQTTLTSSHCPGSCSPRAPPCCQPLVHHQCGQCHHQQAHHEVVHQSEILSDIKTVLENLKNDMAVIKTQATKKNNVATEQAPAKASTTNKKNDEYIDRVSVDIINTAIDDSIASSDEFVPEIPQVPLNCENLTIQQTLLMH